MIYCGVDGGGTKTKVAIFKDDQLLGEIVTERSSIDTIPLNEGIVHIKNAISSLYQKYEISEQIDSIFLGLGGIANPTDINAVNQVSKTIQELSPTAIVNSGNDILNASHASCSGRNNITLIIGTGSVCFGIDEEGQSHRSGGIHYLEGDLGSSYDIGLKLLNMVSQVFDNRLQGSELTSYYLKKLHINTLSDVIEMYITHKNDRTFIASFAKDITKFALDNDKIALQILDDASTEILKHIIAVDSKINLINREVGIIGSLGNAEPYKTMIIKKIAEYDSRLIIHESEIDPVIGSVIEAKMQMKRKCQM